ncbi:cyclic nucleotide-binding domain-containing protein [Halomonas sp. MCCC 1A11036]|uniref:Cyclic nucleotide-binding domain-containing protein n=1 Tax=Billgrantia zhangzhouensis TaxID=2733481 RepID=A0ABS9AL16_9GAMM|nr:cyclic nucleotide-binding domain-containing protein [Halomonas zhangzhouensis]MCE8022413.1 cyclic nucleotide-binding domain-containing protein [Halomonas zhangzhouensis]
MTTGLFFLANFLFCLAYIVRDMAYLRAITILAALSTLPYFYFLESPLYSAIGWQLAFIVINAVNLTVLLMSRRPVSLDDDQRWLHQHTFRILSPREMLRVLRPARRQRCPAHVALIEQGQSLDKLILLLDGEAEVHAGGQHRATLRAGDFAGEMSFVTGKPASACVVTKSPVDYLAWQRRDLEALYHRDPRLKDAMQGVLGADMARKLTR